MKRRDFIKNIAATSAGIAALPTIVPSTVFGKYRPNEKINIAQIGWGRIAKSHDVPSTIRHDMCRFVAVADPDINRAQQGKKWIEDYYKKKTGKDNYVDVKVYQDYREMLQDPSLDAVIISTPDHQHAEPAIAAAYKGLDVYLQKPASLTIDEGRKMADAVARNGIIFQIGSQQRSTWQFKDACEKVRNGAIGKVKRIEIALAFDKACGEEPEMPVPKNLDYDLWLGSTPEVYYTEKRVHPQNSLSSRPGWLRCEQFGAGMITGWGAHHLDIAHWGMGTEFTGPTEIEGTGKFPESGLWNVHLDYDINYKYANGVHMHVCNKYSNGIKFYGEEGWIFVSRGGGGVTASDPDTSDPRKKFYDASDPKILKYDIGPNGIKLYESREHHLNWLECIRSRQQPITPAEVAHRSCTACLLGHIAMKLPRKIYWNPAQERFVNDKEADSMLSRPQRAPYGVDNMKI